MIYVLMAVACSVLVSVLLKLARRLEVDVGQAIAWNYLATSVLTSLVFHPSLAVLRSAQAPWLGFVGLGLLLPLIFLALAASVRSAGIVRTDAAQRLSLLISLLAAFLLFGESLTAAKGAGVALGLLALLCMVWRATPNGGENGALGWHWPLVVFAGFGVIDILFKLVARAGTPFAASLQAMFALALVVSVILLLWRRWHDRTFFTLRDAVAGLLLGLANFGNIVFYVRGHQALPDHPSLVFASMNLGVVALGAVVGTVGFRERLSAVNVIGLVLALGAIGLIAWG
ncbi:EamA/RhaT family transporter [Dyella solisilvae]|uniref:EamA/RhaT family transporter n=1 Tax=Dyella solisilvae TaxID=1920168 RepID=A0A370K973_9GAMM|nr:EamA/RhaT family transporter [Dyella solisilvae]RDI98997.1 EamA/RhaT family transporter [Dyella solisilvae]